MDSMFRRQWNFWHTYRVTGQNTANTLHNHIVRPVLLQISISLLTLSQSNSAFISNKPLEKNHLNILSLLILIDLADLIFVLFINPTKFFEVPRQCGLYKGRFVSTNNDEDTYRMSGGCMHLERSQ